MSNKLNQLLITTDTNNINGVRKAPITDTLHLLIQRTLKEMPSAEGTLVPVHTFLTSIKSVDQWNKKGILIQSLGEKIYPEFGVFPPTQQTHLELLEHAIQQVYNKNRVILNYGLDVGTGTGVLAFLLARKFGVQYVRSV